MMTVINRKFYSLLNPYLYRISARSSRPALIWATERGQEKTARTSMQEGPESGWTDCHGRGLVSQAASSGHDGILRLLLEHGNTTVDLRDHRGRTPLSWAPSSGRETALQLLLGTEKAQVDSKDDGGRTPLSWAAKRFDEDIIKLLREYKKAQLDFSGQEDVHSWSRGTIG